MATKKEIRGVIVPRHDTARNWSNAVDFTPENGELIIISADNATDVARGYYLDSEGNKLTSITVNSNGVNKVCAIKPSDKVRFKFGNGKDNVNALPFQTDALQDTASGSTILIDDISPVTHEMSVKISSDTVTDLTAVKVTRCGKNLIPLPYSQLPIGTTTLNGIEFTVYEDGSILMNGTATTGFSIYLYDNKQDLLGLRAGDIITGSKWVSDYNQKGNFNLTFNYYNIDGDMKEGVINLKSQQNLTTTITEDYVGWGIYIYILSGKTFDNLLFKPQLELGETATDYEPYVEPTEYTPNADGTVNGVTSLYPNTTLITDTEDVLINCEYLTKLYTEVFGSASAVIKGNGNSSIKQNLTNTSADGDGSISLGVDSKSYNTDSISLGRQNKNYSHTGITAGYNNIAGKEEYKDKQWGDDPARGAIAIGWNNNATHTHACVFGITNNSSGDGQTIFGRFCANDPNALFILGNGASEDNRSNLYTVDGEGNGCFTGDVYVGSSKKDGAGSKRLATEEYIDKKIEVSDTAPIEEENKIWLKPITDSSEYIIEEGTNGIWTYRIWNSGISECWGKKTISVTTSTSNNGYYTGSVGSLQYPSNLFISEPVLNCTLKASSFPGHLFIDGTESSSYTGKISIAAHSNTTVNGYIHLSAKGRWK